MSSVSMSRMLLAALTAGAFTLGCGDGDTGPKTFQLTTGIYEFTPTEYNPNTCWTEAQAFPPIIPLQFDLTANTDGTFLFAGSGIAEGLIPDITGTVDGNAMVAGPESFEIDAREAEEAEPEYTGAPGGGDCWVVFAATLDGTLTKSNEFDTILDISISDKNGDGCSELYGKQLDIGLPVPFPQVDGKTCNLTPIGHTMIQLD